MCFWTVHCGTCCSCTFKGSEHLFRHTTRVVTLVLRRRLIAGPEPATFGWTLVEFHSSVYRGEPEIFHCVVMLPVPTHNEHKVWGQEQNKLNITAWNVMTHTHGVGGCAAKLHRLQSSQPISPSVYEATGQWQTWGLSLKFCTSVYKTKLQHFRNRWVLTLIFV